MKRLFFSMGAGGGAFVLAFFSAISYVFGMARDLFLAHYFGAGLETDAFMTAFLIPDFIFSLFIAGSLSGVLMPMLITTGKKSKEESEKLFSVFISVMNMLIVFISIISFFLTPFLIERIFSSMSPEKINLNINLTRILLLSPILFGISNSFGSLLIAKKRFFSFAISPILYNAGILAGIYFLHDKIGIYSAVVGVVGGIILHASIRILDFSHLDFSLKPSFDLKNKDFLRVLKLALPKTLGLLAFQVMLWSFAYMGNNFLEEGSFSAFNYARNIQSFSVSIFGIALATAVFPFLSEFFAEKNNEKFVHRLEKSAREILFLALPAGVGLFVLSGSVVNVLFAHGNFNEKDALLTTGALMAIAFSIPAESLTHIFSRAFLARQNTIIPTISQFLLLLVAGGGAFLFSKEYGVISFGVAFSLATFLQFVFLFLIFHFSVARFPMATFLKSASLVLFMSLLMGGAVYFVQSIFSGILALVLSFGVGILVYFSLAILFKMREMERIMLYFNNK